MTKVILKSLNTLINDDDYAIISREGNPGLFVQWFLVYHPKHEILKICIENCILQIEQSKGIKDVAKLTGPFVYSKSVNEYFNIEVTREDFAKPGDNNIYWISDDILNKNKEKTKVRFFSVDYGGYVHYIHPHRNLLYQNTTSWREEQKQKYGF